MANNHSRAPRRRYNGYSEFYSSSSAAYDILRERYYDEMLAPRRPKVKRKHKARPKQVYKLNTHNHPRMAVMPMLTLIVFFAGMFAMVFFGVRIIEAQKSIKTLNKEYQEVADANVVKNAMLSKSYDLKEVEAIALTRLGMIKPSQHQILHVSVPKQNYVVQNLSYAEENESIFAKIAAFSKRVFAMAALQ